MLEAGINWGTGGGGSVTGSRLRDSGCWLRGREREGLVPLCVCGTGRRYRSGRRMVREGIGGDGEMVDPEAVR